MGWLITLLVLAGLVSVPLGIRGVYQQGGPRLWVLAGPAAFQIYPGTAAKKQKSVNKKSAPSNASASKKKAGGSLKDFEPLLRTALAFLGDLRKKLRVNRLELQLIMAGDDPCDLAVSYGRAWASVGNLLPLLERVFIIKRRDVDVSCDFTLETTKIYLRVDMTITFGRIIFLLTKYGIQAFRQYNTIKNQSKGGAKL